MDITTAPQTPKSTILSEITQAINQAGYHIVDQDMTRPWGGFFVLAEQDKLKFIQEYFSDHVFTDAEKQLKLSQKFLVVAPRQRLSWQYHQRRSEVWKVVIGPVKVILSETDAELEPQTYHQGDLINIPLGYRHRLIGADSWGVVAEIWQHNDLNNPSDESEIIRLQDDYSRK